MIKSNKTIQNSTVTIDNLQIPVFSFNTIIVGTGAAGYNAADSLFNLGNTDIAIVTEGIKMGTSRNTGSDKQTYYKLTMSGDGSDSIYETAKTLFEGGSMNGDTALVEAALSAQCFFKLVNIGVKFPFNTYGEYIGYKTDHDPRQRATSCGPLTSKFMTEQLEKTVTAKDIPVFDGYRIISVITKDNSCVGLLAIDKETSNFTIFNCTNVIYATGGPSAIYKSSVYPESQTCASGAAFEAGVKGINLTESQYGIASTKFRWNLSGTYQQVIPRYVSTAPDGSDEKEFLDEYFENTGAMLDAIFLKGYQWPFDPRKLTGTASSMVDIAVYNETRIKGRRVFMDFLRNPSAADKNGNLDFSLLNKESYEYLSKSNAMQKLPIDRLLHMNTPAVDLYKNNGIDLTKEYLEIDVCAQHNNGGLSCNIWYESNLKHFFPVGEVCGVFGVYRPGGSALNSTQVSSLRAAQFIAANYRQNPISDGEIADAVEGQVLWANEVINKAKTNNGTSIYELRDRYQNRMSLCGAQIRDIKLINEAIKDCKKDIYEFSEISNIKDEIELPDLFINRDILLTQLVYLSALKAYIDKGGKSRGSYLIVADKFDPKAVSGIDTGKTELDTMQLVTSLNGNLECETQFVKVKDIPKTSDDWFENVWNAFNRGEIIK